MKPIEFTDDMKTFGRNQQEYNPLPALDIDDGMILICWRLSFLERIQILFSGRIWHIVKTFGLPLQPILLLTKRPEAQK